MSKIDTRLRALEKAKQPTGTTLPTWPTLAEWQAERNTEAFLRRYPWVAARRLSAQEAERLAGL